VEEWGEKKLKLGCWNGEALGALRDAMKGEREKRKEGMSSESRKDGEGEGGKTEGRSKGKQRRKPHRRLLSEFLTAELPSDRSRTALAKGPRGSSWNEAGFDEKMRGNVFVS